MLSKPITAHEALMYAIGREHATSDLPGFVYIPVNEFADRVVADCVTSVVRLRKVYDEMLAERAKPQDSVKDSVRCECDGCRDGGACHDCEQYPCTCGGA
jgi:hypothetical protein